MERNKIWIINVFIPPDGAGKMRIFYKLQELLNVGYDIMCGDFDTITDKADRIPFKHIPITKDGNLLKKICDKTALKDPNKSHFTRIDKMVKTRIDRIYVSKSFKTITYNTEYLVDSDNLAVNVKLILGLNEIRGYWKLNTIP